MGGLIGSKPKSTPVPTVVQQPAPRKVEAPTPVVPKEDEGALAEARR